MSPLVSQYAETLCANSHNQMPIIAKDFSLFIDLLQNCSDFFHFFTSHRVSKDSKIKLIQSVFQVHISSSFQKFLELVIEKNRTGLIKEIYNVFQDISRPVLNRLGVEVTVANQDHIDDQHILVVIRSFISANKKRLNLLYYNKDTQIDLKVLVDSSILGGLRLRVNNYYVDLSVSEYLDSYHRKVLS